MLLNSPLEQFTTIHIFGFYFFGFDFSFLNVIIPLVIVLFFFKSFVNFFIKDFRLIPDFWQFFFEALFKFILDIITQQVGKAALVYFPFVFNLFIFVLFCNFISLTPFGLALTSHIIVIFFLSFSLWLSVFLIGLLTHNTKFLKLFVPEAPFFILFLLLPIELVSYAIRALSLALRLSANIMAGHILVYIISSFVLYMGTLKFWFYITGIILFAILILELGVAFVQAYVFTVLFCIYLNDSLKSPGH